MGWEKSGLGYRQPLVSVMVFWSEKQSSSTWKPNRNLISSAYLIVIWAQKGKKKEKEKEKKITDFTHIASHRNHISRTFSIFWEGASVFLFLFYFIYLFFVCVQVLQFHARSKSCNIGRGLGGYVSHTCLLKQ